MDPRLNLFPAIPNNASWTDTLYEDDQKAPYKADSQGSSPSFMVLLKGEDLCSSLLVLIRRRGRGKTRGGRRWGHPWFIAIKIFFFSAQCSRHFQRRLVSKVSISTQNCVKIVHFDTFSTILAKDLPRVGLPGVIR